MPIWAGNTPQVFISYSQEDHAFAENLANQLTKDDVSVWFDRWRIHVGDSIVRKIQDGLTSCDFLVILLSPASTESRWVEQELNVATIKDIESTGAFILPVLIQNCHIPPFLTDRKYADFTRDPSAGYQSLLAAIDHHFGSQRHKRRAIRDSRLSIVHIFKSKENDFPVVKCTISNRSGATQIVNRLGCDVVDIRRTLGIPESRVLKSLAVWDIELPDFEGRFTYRPADPILIADTDAVTISLRFHCGHNEAPQEKYTIRVRFKSDQGLMAASELIQL